MRKPKRVESYPEQAYPRLADLTSDRRAFLKRSVLSALAAVAGGRLLSGCQLYESGQRTAGEPKPPDYFDVRLPAEGSASLYLTEGDYLVYAVTLITYDEAVAVYLRGHAEAALEAVAGALGSLHCGEVTDDTSRAQVEQSLRAALEEHARQNVPGAVEAVASVTLLVESCEDNVLAGDIGP